MNPGQPVYSAVVDNSGYPPGAPISYATGPGNTTGPNPGYPTVPGYTQVPLVPAASGDPRLDAPPPYTEK